MEYPEPNVKKDNDSTLEAEIHALLKRLGYNQLNMVRCSAQGNEVVLSGELDSYYLKQVAQSVALNAPGVCVVRNEIQVL